MTWMYASSAADTRGCAPGGRYMIIQGTIHIALMSPVARNADCHPKRTVIQGTTSGAIVAPMFAPELKMPVASARSFFGNHSATVLIAAGKLPDSPSPRRNVEIPKTQYRSLARDRSLAKLQSPMDTGSPNPRSGSIDEPSRQQQADGIRRLERIDDVAAAVLLVPSDDALQFGCKHAQDLPVDVIDGCREEQQRADSPAVTAHAGGCGRKICRDCLSLLQLCAPLARPALALAGRVYLISRISFSLALTPDRSCRCSRRSASGSLRAPASSSSLIVLSLSSFFTCSLASRRILRSATRWSSATWCSRLTISLRRSSVSGGIGTRIDLAVVGRIQPQVGRADRLLDGADLRNVPGLHRDQRRLRHMQVGHLVQRRRRSVVVHANVVEQTQRGAAGADGGHLVLQIAEITFSMRVFALVSTSLTVEKLGWLGLLCGSGFIRVSV